MIIVGSERGIRMRFSVPDGLPATDLLRREGIILNQGEPSGLKSLKILLLNLMPTKTVTETQIIRMLSSAGLDIDMDLMKTVTYTSKNADSEYMNRFYKGFDEYSDSFFDGFIVTGAPVELFDYGQVLYWDELCRIFDWAETHVRSVFSICWGAQAILYHRYGIEKRALPEKMFGVFEHDILDSKNDIVRGLKNPFATPHSRHTEVTADDILKQKDLSLVACSKEAGVHIVASADLRLVCSMGHSEYDADTLSREYFRDLEKGENIAKPKHYFPNDDPALIPGLTWRETGKTLYGNWVRTLAGMNSDHLI